MCVYIYIYIHTHTCILLFGCLDPPGESMKPSMGPEGDHGPEPSVYYLVHSAGVRYCGALGP